MTVNHAIAGLLLLSLSACGALLPLPPAQPTVAATPTAEALAATATASATNAFKVRQRALGEEAERLGHWAQAGWAWEALRALEPQDAELISRQERAEQAAESLATLRTSQARLALQLGDTAASRDLMLKALAAQPLNNELFEGLRALENENVLQHLASKDTRHPLPRTLNAAIELEQAHYLAAQGELEAAAELLRALSVRRPPEASAKRHLADVYQQLAEKQYANDPLKAMATMRLALQADSRLQSARKKLQEWTAAQRAQGSAKGPSNKP